MTFLEYPNFTHPLLTIYNFGDDAFQGHMKKLDSNPYYTAVEVQVGYLVADSITNAMGSK